MDRFQFQFQGANCGPLLGASGHSAHWLPSNVGSGPISEVCGGVWSWKSRRREEKGNSSPGKMEGPAERQESLRGIDRGQPTGKTE